MAVLDEPTLAASGTGAGLGAIRRLTALLVRSLQADVRRVIGHFARGFAAAGMLLTITFVLINAWSVGSPGLKVFRWLVWCDALFISASAIVFFAPVIGAEREAGSLSLLRMTGTSPLTLVLGHSLGGIVIGSLLIAVQLPFTVLTITLGGVLWNQVMAAFVALAAHLILCAGIGLFLSVLCKRAGTAALYTLLVILALWVGPMLARQIASAQVFAQRLSRNAQVRIDDISDSIDTRLIWSRLESISTGDQEILASQFYWAIGGGLFLLAAAAAMLDWRPLEVSPYSPIVIRLWRSSGQRAWRWAPVAGKDYRQFMGGFKGAIARCIIYPAVPLGLLAAVKRGDSRMMWDQVFEATFWMAWVFLVMEVWAIAARLVRNEIVEQTWSTLILTPNRLETVLAEKVLAAAIGILPGIVVCAAFAMTSTEVRRYWTDLVDGVRMSDGTRVMMMQPVTCAAICAACSMLIPSLPPMVSMFVAFLCTVVQYVILGVTCDSMRWRSSMSMRVFAVATIATCLASAIICERRLRKFAERD